jgi:hypothetical protein
VKIAKHKDFDSFLGDLTAEEQAICLQIKAVLLENFPEMHETWAYGAPCYALKKRVCSACLPCSGLKNGVKLGFSQGHRLSKQNGLLDMGGRKEVAYIYLSTLGDVLREETLEILHEAVISDNELFKERAPNNLSILGSRFFVLQGTRRAHSGAT